MIFGSWRKGCDDLNTPVTAVMYHYVRERDKDGIRLNSLDVQVFEEQVKYFVRNYCVLSVEELLEGNLRGIKKEILLLTFDDGYLDHYEYVLPILDKYKVKGTFYIPTRILNDEFLDINKIHLLLATTSTDAIISSLFRILNQYRSEYKLASNEEYIKRYAVPTRWDDRKIALVKKTLQTGLPESVRLRALDNLFQKFVLNGVRVPRLYLSKKEIMEMSLMGMCICAHTHNHPHLADCSESKQRYEIATSIELLRQIGIGSPELSFCYPFGDFDSNSISILQDLDVKVAFTVEPRKSICLDATSRYQFPRMDCNDIFV
jgi:peptidoglycan/xylan/chitin deacetylase (PgdA/CDA1 family)